MFTDTPWEIVVLLLAALALLLLTIVAARGLARERRAARAWEDTTDYTPPKVRGSWTPPAR